MVLTAAPHRPFLNIYINWQAFPATRLPEGAEQHILCEMSPLPWKKLTEQLIVVESN